MFKIAQLISPSPQAAIVEDIASRVWNEHYGKILSQGQIDYMLGKFQSAEAIQQQIADGYEYYLIEYQQGTYQQEIQQETQQETQNSDVGPSIPVGYFSIKAAQDSDGRMKLFLGKFYILKEFRGRGAGSSVFDFLEHKAAAKCLQAIWLTVNKYNQESISVYLHRGYKIVREQVADIGNGYVMDDYIMQKPIS